MEGRMVHLQFHTFSIRFVYRWHLTMQGTREHGQSCQITGKSLRTDIQSIVVRMTMCIRLIYVRLSIHSTHCHCHDGAFSWSMKFSVDIFRHRLNGNTFWLYRQYTLYLKILHYSSLVVVLSNFIVRHYAVVAGDYVLNLAFNQWIRVQSWIAFW